MGWLAATCVVCFVALSLVLIDFLIGWRVGVAIPPASRAAVSLLRSVSV